MLRSVDETRNFKDEHGNSVNLRTFTHLAQVLGKQRRWSICLSNRNGGNATYKDCTPEQIAAFEKDLVENSFYNRMCDAMKRRIVMTLQDSATGEVVKGIINGIAAEDNTRDKWLVTLNTREKPVFILTALP